MGNIASFKPECWNEKLLNGLNGFTTPNKKDWITKVKRNTKNRLLVSLLKFKSRRYLDTYLDFNFMKQAGDTVHIRALGSINISNYVPIS